MTHGMQNLFLLLRVLRNRNDLRSRGICVVRRARSLYRPVPALWRARAFDRLYDQAKSKRSRFITLTQAATKSFTKRAWPSSQA